MITSTTNKMSGVTGTSAAQTISFTFIVFAATEVTVVKRLTSTGAETTLTKDTDYTVSLTADSSSSGYTGSITTLSPYISSSYTIHVYRTTTQTQATDWVENDEMGAETLEAAFDKLFCLYADLKEQIGRCIKIPVSDETGTTVELPADVSRASETCQFDSDGSVTSA